MESLNACADICDRREDNGKLATHANSFFAAAVRSKPGNGFEPKRIKLGIYFKTLKNNYFKPAAGLICSFQTCLLIRPAQWDPEGPCKALKRPLRAP